MKTVEGLKFFKKKVSLNLVSSLTGLDLEVSVLTFCSDDLSLNPDVRKSKKTKK